MTKIDSEILNILKLKIESLEMPESTRSILLKIIFAELDERAEFNRSYFD